MPDFIAVDEINSQVITSESNIKNQIKTSESNTSSNLTVIENNIINNFQDNNTFYEGNENLIPDWKLVSSGSYYGSFEFNLPTSGFYIIDMITRASKSDTSDIIIYDSSNSVIAKQSFSGRDTGRIRIMKQLPAGKIRGVINWTTNYRYVEDIKYQKYDNNIIHQLSTESNNFTVPISQKSGSAIVAIYDVYNSNAPTDIYVSNNSYITYELKEKNYSNPLYTLIPLSTLTPVTYNLRHSKSDSSYVGYGSAFLLYTINATTSMKNIKNIFFGIATSVEKTVTLKTPTINPNKTMILFNREALALSSITSNSFALVNLTNTPVTTDYQLIEFW